MTRGHVPVRRAEARGIGAGDDDKRHDGDDQDALFPELFRQRGDAFVLAWDAAAGVAKWEVRISERPDARSEAAPAAPAAR